MQKEKLEALATLKGLYEQILKERNCLSLKELAVTGSDLIEGGLEPGPKLGEILKKLLELVIEHPEYNTKEYLLSHLPKL